jgi:integrase
MLDIPAWWAETEKLLPMRRDLHRAMLLTGARRTSILTVRRSDVDLDRKVLTFQHMKIGPPMMLPMGERLAEMLRKRLEDDFSLGSEWLWPSGTNPLGRTVDPRARGHDSLPSAHEYRHIARTLFIASGAPYAESALLLGQKLPGASGGYVHPEHLVEHLRPFMQKLENFVFARVD